MAMAAYGALIAAGVGHAGLYATASLRIESGHRAFGTGFVGETAVQSQTHTRRIVSILFDDRDAIPILDEPIYYDGRVVGQITSAAWSHRFERSVALALVDLSLDVLAKNRIADGFTVDIA